MGKKVRGYVAGVVVCACVGAALIAASGDPDILRSAEAGLCFAFLGIFAQLLRYDFDANTSATIVFIPFLATIFLAPTWVSLVSITAVACFGATIKKQTALKSVFNVAQYGLVSTAAIETYRWLGGAPWLVRIEYNWFAYIAAFSVFVLLNTLLVTQVVTLSEGKRFANTWITYVKSSVLYDVLSLPLAYLFAAVYIRYGALGALVLGLPLLAARQLYKTNWQLARVNQELLELMVAAIEARDPYTSGHSRRVARNARIIAQAIGLGSRDVDRVAVAALLHDVGKIHEAFAPLLRKPGKLTSDERATMETHPIKSAELVQNVSHLNDVVMSIRNHHENWDGTGYPDGLRGEDIPLWSRIVMIADTVDAMTTDRPYRAAMTESDVRSELLRLRGKQFDPDICDQLLRSPLYISLFEGQPARVSGEIRLFRQKTLGARLAAGA